jgi:hypothetical protein
MVELNLDEAILVDAPDDAEIPDDDAAPKRTRKPRSDKGQPRGTRGTGGRPSRASASKKLADELLQPWAVIAAGCSMTAPTVAGVMMERGEKTVDSIVKIAEKHPRMMKALQKASEVGAFAELFQTGFQMAIAAGMDFGRIPTDSPLGMLSGVSEIYAMTHPPVPPQGPNGVPNSGPMGTPFGNGMPSFPNGMPSNMMPFPMPGTPNA